MSFREANQVQYVASSELSNASAERTQFGNVDLTRKDKPLFSGQKACRTNTAQPLGLWKSLPVTKGDKVKVNAEAFYQGTASNTSINWNAFFYVNPNYGSGIINGENITNPHNPLNMVGVGIIPTFSGNSTSVPKSYLIAQFFDKNNISYKQIIRYVNVSHQNTWLSLPEINEEVLQNGRVEIFVANESNIAVFFDNLTITHLPTLISQENHYYAFGMNAKEIEKEGNNKWQYNGQEKYNDFGLDWSNYKYRFYDFETTRFFGVDPIAEQYEYLTPYQFASCNPASKIEIEGLEGVYQQSVKKEDKNVIAIPYVGEVQISAAITLHSTAIKANVLGVGVTANAGVEEIDLIGWRDNDFTMDGERNTQLYQRSFIGLGIGPFLGGDAKADIINGQTVDVFSSAKAGVTKVEEHNNGDTDIKFEVFNLKLAFIVGIEVAVDIKTVKPQETKIPKIDYKKPPILQSNNNLTVSGVGNNQKNDKSSNKKTSQDKIKYTKFSDKKEKDNVINYIKSLK